MHEFVFVDGNFKPIYWRPLRISNSLNNKMKYNHIATYSTIYITKILGNISTNLTRPTSYNFSYCCQCQIFVVVVKSRFTLQIDIRFVFSTFFYENNYK